MTALPSQYPQLGLYERAALQWVNQQRTRMGAPTLAQLAPGVCHDPSRCSLAESLAIGWIGAVWHSGDDNLGDVQIPDSVRDFVVHFDIGHYPELVVK